MLRFRALSRRILASGGVVLALAACTGPRPFLRQGDANSAEIGYSGDIADTLPIARQHCAQFERVPRLVDAGLEIAHFDCVGR
jgi:hypothetical protein